MARNYLARARALACSLERHQPGAELHTLVIDAAKPVDDAQLRIWSTSDLALAPESFEQMATMYNVTELATALKPWLIERLLEGSDSHVTYLDPDTHVEGVLPEFSALSGENRIVVTPHVLGPVPRDGRFPDDEVFLLRGQYNLGYITVPRGASAFLAWWKERLRWNCLDLVEAGLFVDQKWLDLGVRLFPSAVLADPGFNVAYWNLHERPLEFDGERYLAGGVPLRLMHFSGYDLDRPDQFSHWPWGTLRADPSVDVVATRLLRSYGEHVGRHSEASGGPGYAWATVDGVALSHELRRAYRDALMRGSAPTRPLSEPGALSRWARRANA